MYRLKILIIDDEAPARQRMMTLIGDIQEAFPCELVGEAAGAQQGLDLLIEKQADVLLLDVQMPGMTGIELAQHIAQAKLPNPPAIVFVTAYDDYALKAFEVHAMDYLLKPVRASRLQETLKRIASLRVDTHVEIQHEKLSASLKNIPQKRQNFSVLEKNRVLLIPVREVLFLKAEQKYVTIQTRDRAHLTEESLVSIEQELGDIFVRVHRNALVARSVIMGVERAAQPIDAENEGEKASDSWQVIVRDSGERLPISRRQWSVIKTLVR